MEVENMQNRQLHFVLVPLLAQGHMIPIIDMAKMFAKRGVRVTLVITPNNASRSARAIIRARDSGLPIHVLEIPFPGHEVGLPCGCENLDSVPSKDLLRQFYTTLHKLQEPLESYLEEVKDDFPPSCIISDKCLYWTSDTARRFQVPRIVFHGTCLFSLLISHNISLYKPHLSVDSDAEPFIIPGMPIQVEIMKAQLPGAFVTIPTFNDIRDKMCRAEQDSYGVVVNTFAELEQGSLEEYRKAINKKVWCIGPVSQCNEENQDKFERGNPSSIDENLCIEWLDSKSPGTVIYACLGSQCRLVPSQLIQLGLGLESSSHPFIWVVKTGDETFSEELEKWLSDSKYEERVRGRGLIIKGWAPQVLILSHPAIRGFLTHCGWNSTIEGVCSGVPMITWPMFAEQFLNEKLIVEVLRIGVRVGVELPVRWGEEERVGVLVTKEMVAKAIEKLTENGEEGEERKVKAKELALTAKNAMQVGGSANVNISELIQDIMGQVSLKRNHACISK